MPEVTDLQKVAQYAKSSGAPSDVYNAACRLLDGPDAKRIEVLQKWTAALDKLRRDSHELLNAAKTGAESDGDGRTPQILGAGEGQATPEAHGAVDVRPTSMRRRVDFDTNGDPQ